ncbi:MAG TPA: hypothetical protein VFD49_12855 [Candidatus Dormibacteraeota bacterium]|nr:hypothetical protein [Candidatus Dormibacteraeota bacterium]
MQIEAPLTEDRPPAREGSLEEALERLDGELKEVSLAVERLRRTLAAACEASQQGRLRDLPGALRALAEAAERAHRRAGQVPSAWTFPAREHLEGGGYLEEVRRLAAEAGLEGVREIDGQLYSYPLVVRLRPSELALMVGRRRERALRPGHVVGQLKSARERSQRGANLESLLQTFERAYLTLTGDQESVAVPLKRLYDLLVLRPGSSREYTELDFYLDVYRLDRTGPHLTRAGRELSFPASTSARSGRAFRLPTETGEERLYASIRFDPARAPEAP